MIDINKNYRTRAGHEVRIYATDGKPYQQIHGAISIDGKWEAAQWYDSGVYYGYGTRCFDLVEVKPRIKETIYINIYDGYTSISYSEKVAEERADCSIRARVKVDIDVEEGHGL